MMSINLTNRKSGKHIVICVLGLIIIISTICVRLFGSHQEEPMSFVERRLRYSYTIRNNSSYAVPEAKLIIPIPISNNVSQELLELKVSKPHGLNDTGTMHPSASVVMLVAPYGTKEISVEALVKKGTRPSKEKNGDLQRYLIPEKYIELKDPAVIAKGQGLCRETPLATAKAIQEWVSEFIHDDTYYSENRGASAALHDGKGDCSEHSFLFVALARICHLPARTVGGFALEKDDYLKASSYHQWAEFFHDEQWHLVDTQRKIFDQDYGTYIAFRVSDLESESALSAHALFSIEPKEISGRMD